MEGFFKTDFEAGLSNSFGDEDTATESEPFLLLPLLLFRAHSKPVEHEHETLPKVEA